MTGLLTGHYPLKGLLLQLGLVDSCEGSMTVSHCNYED